MSELAPATLGDERVRLRPWRAGDVPDQLMGFADETVQRFSWGEERPYTGADAHTFFAHQEAGRRRGTELGFAFVRPEDEATVVGGGSLHGIDPEVGCAAVGYWLTAAARGRGLASRATRLMAGYAFSELRIVRLELTCAPDNHASRAVAERCGFTCEGVLRSHLPFKGTRRDSVLFSLLPGELR